jgi:hypothetical protein
MRLARQRESLPPRPMPVPHRTVHNRFETGRRPPEPAAAAESWQRSFSRMAASLHEPLAAAQSMPKKKRSEFLVSQAEMQIAAMHP